MNRTRLIPLLAFSLTAQACGGPQTAAPASAKNSIPAPAGPAGGAGDEWDAFVHRYIEDALRDNPTWAVSTGRHEYDGQVADLSPEGIARTTARVQAALEQARAFNTAGWDDTRRFEQAYLVAEMEGRLFWLTKIKSHERDPLLYMRQIAPSVYLTRDYAPLEQRMDAYIKLAARAPKVVEQMKANLKTPLPRTFVQVGIKVFGGLGPYLEKDVPATFAAVKDEARQRALTEVNPSAVKAAQDATAWLKAQLPSATDDFALGEALFKEMLWATERVDVPLERLMEVGQADLERNLKALTQACERITPGKPVKDCVAKVQGQKPPQGPVVGARRQLDGLRSFLLEHKLVTIPGSEIAKVEESPPYRRWNAAYIEIPGPFEKKLPSVYYIAPPDPSWSEQDRRAYIPGEADLLFISVHEVWPGHFLHYLHANRSPRLVGRLFGSYAFAEGWAHYAEEMMWEAGLGDGDPVTHVGQLLNALLRNVRFISAIGLHTQGMTVEQSEALFRDKGMQDPGNAKQQAARGTFDPGYLNYTLGKLILRKLREDWTESRGGRAAWGEFHDRVLSFGSPPLPLVREAMLGETGELL